MPILATTGHVDAQVIGASGGVHNGGTTRWLLLRRVVGDERIDAQHDHEYDREGHEYTDRPAAVENGATRLGAYLHPLPG